MPSVVDVPWPYAPNPWPVDSLLVRRPFTLTRLSRVLQELLLRGLSVSVEPLEDGPPSTPDASTRPGTSSFSSVSSRGSNTNSTTNSNNTNSNKGGKTAHGGSGDKRVFLLEPTTVSAQAYVVSTACPRQHRENGTDGSAGGGGRRGGGPSTVRAISITGEAWRTMRPSLLQNLPNLMRTWAQVGGQRYR